MPQQLRGLVGLEAAHCPHPWQVPKIFTHFEPLLPGQTPQNINADYELGDTLGE